MNEYIVRGTVNNVIYRYYNKRYTTPPIFREYNFSLPIFLTNIAISVVLLTLFDDYQYVYLIDMALAITYLFNKLVVREGYRNGIINACVSPSTKSYNFATYLAIVSQGALYRIILPTAYVLLYQYGDFGEYLELYPGYGILSGFIALCSVISLFGITSKTKFYTKSAQKAYRAIIEGPSACHYDVDTLIKNNMDFKIQSLKSASLATSEYYKAREKFLSTAEQIRSEIENHDNNWRRAVMFGGYESVKNFNTGMIRDYFSTLCLEHRKNAEKLNKIIMELNSQSVNASSNRFIKRNTNTVKKVPVLTTNVNNTSVDDTWAACANWYR